MALTEIQGAQILALRESGLTVREISKQCRVSQDTVIDYSSAHGKNYVSKNNASPGFLSKVELLKKKFNDNLFLKANTLMKGITQEKINKANLLQVSTSFGILYDKYRLNTNKSTQNVSLIANLSTTFSNDIDE